MGVLMPGTMYQAGKATRTAIEGPHPNVVSAFLFVACFGAGLIETVMRNDPTGLIVGLLIGLTVMQSPKVAKQWERAVVLRLGRYHGLHGPGLFWVVPFMDSISSWID